MDLDELYRDLRAEAFPAFATGKEAWDPLIDEPEDDRYGITLLLRPDDTAGDHIREFLSEVSRLEPGQYPYPSSDLHVTVMSIISCYRGFAVENIEPEEYGAIIRKALTGIRPFAYRFRGITASPSCLMIQGYFPDNILNVIRERLRSLFGSSGLQHSIDARYKTESGHSTVLRFRKPLSDGPALVQFLQEQSERDFGEFLVQEFELVANDWYQRTEKCRVLQRFLL